jgi:hypothetical protein
MVTQALSFLEVFFEMIDPKVLTGIATFWCPSPRGTLPKLTWPQFISALVFHQLQEGGTLANSIDRLHGVTMAGSSPTERRERLPIHLFDQIMQCALAPLADLKRHADCFYKGLRLIGLDGTQLSATNTPDIVKQLGKAACRRLKAAFAKIRLLCAVELGTHAPVAAAAAPSSDGEQTVARRLWRMLPDNSLVVMDRLFGTAYTLYQALAEIEERKVFFLVRVKSNIKVEVIQRFPDGSALVQVQVREAGKVIAQLTLREIYAKGVGRDGKKFILRLWTTLLEWKRFPANELAERYATRWESELYFHELKVDVRESPVLASHTVKTAFQEVAAIVLASAVVARMRLEAADRLKVPVRRVSFFKLMLATRKLWGTFEYTGDSIPVGMKARICKNYMDDVRKNAMLPERRERSCPRVVRQTVKKWPRKITQQSYKGKVSVTVTRA